LQNIGRFFLYLPATLQFIQLPYLAATTLPFFFSDTRGTLLLLP
jgi:hypothetical protein